MSGPQKKTGGRKPQLPSLDVKDIGRLVQLSGLSGSGGKGAIPNAALIYGVGAAGLFVMALYSLFTGSWFTAFLLLLPAGALFGFALQYLKEGS